MQTYDNRRTSIPECRAKTAKWRSQAQRVYESLMESPKTRLQVSNETHTPLQNTCRYIGTLRKLGKVCVVKRAIDPMSKTMAEYLSTNPSICQPCSAFVQLKMFN